METWSNMLKRVIVVRFQSLTAGQEWASHEPCKCPRRPSLVHIDWVTGFPVSPEGFNAVLVFICALTGMVHLQACKRQTLPETQPTTSSRMW